MERGPVIIEAAINGNRTKEHNPNVPRSHEELANDTLETLAAGASIIHNHGSVFGDPRAVADDYLAGWMPVFAERPDALLYPTANYGPNGLDFEHLHLLAETGLMKVSLCDPGSTNLGGIDADGLPPQASCIRTVTTQFVCRWNKQPPIVLDPALRFTNRRSCARRCCTGKRESFPPEQ